MRVLIIDDDELIVDVMVALLEKYAYEQQEEVLYEYAYDGAAALKKVEDNFFDLIYVDVMLPDMSGVDVTKEIKKLNKKSLVVAVSSLGDEETQSELLLVGAEDYFVKPINATLFLRRLSNYTKLIKSRNKIHSNEKHYNLYTSLIYNYNISFHIDNEDSLAQVWETLLIRLDLGKIVQGLNDVVRVCFNLGLLQLEEEKVFDIIIEEDENHFYFTVNNISFADMNVEEMMFKCYSDALYTFDSQFLSIVLQKREDTPQSSEDKSKQIDQAGTMKNISKSVNIVHESEKELHVYDFLNSEELNVFEESLDALYLSVEKMREYQLTAEEVTLISCSLYKVGTLLGLESESFVVSESLFTLSKTIEENQELFIEKAQELETFVLAFLNDLYEWKKMVFIEGAPSIDFMNDSIYSNAKMLESLLVAEESESSDDIDDIFAF